MTETHFHYHRGIAPMMWVFVALAAVELLAVHLVLSLKWHALAWPLSALSLVTMFWLVRWIGSMKRLPHLLSEDRIAVKLGTFRALDIPLSDIARVRSSWESGDEKGAGVSNLVPIAYPNRLLELEPPLAARRGHVRRVVLRLDDADAFDRALRKHGIVTE